MRELGSVPQLVAGTTSPHASSSPVPPSAAGIDVASGWSRVTALLSDHPDPVYRDEHTRADRMRARLLALYCLVLYPLFGILDYITYEQHLRLFLGIRASVAALAAFVLALSFRSAHSGPPARVLGAVATLGVVWMCVHSEGFRSNYVIGVILCFLAITTLELYRPQQVLLAQLSIFAIYFVLNLTLHAPVIVRDAVSASFFLFGSLIFCVIASLLLEHNRRRLHHARAELQLRNEDLELAQQQQRELLRTITHELRTPINSVLGFIELIELQDAGVASSTRDRLKRMTSTSRRLLAVINDILDLSRIEACKLALICESCQISAVLEDVAVEIRALLKARPVTVEVHCEHELTWYTDPLRLRQIITNLAGNAVKFTPEGFIRMSAELDGSQRELLIRVSDTGIGIREEDKRYLLEPFAQTKEGRVAGGTGLGLSISKGLVALMGGTLTFTSQQGQGTTFEVRIPAQRQESR